MMVGLDSSELVRAAERFLLQPNKTEAKDAKEEYDSDPSDTGSDSGEGESDDEEKKN